MIIKTQDNPRLVPGMFIFENSGGITMGGTLEEKTVHILAGNGSHPLGIYGSKERIAQIQEQIAESFTHNEKMYQMPAE